MAAEDYIESEPVDLLDIPGLPAPEVGDPEQVGPDTSAVDALQFDPKFRQALDGLMHIGCLRKEFTWLGHRFQIKTLTVDELLEVGLLVKQYDGSIGAQRAYITACAAACIERVDGKLIVTPIGPSDNILSEKFRYARQYWYNWTIDRIYTELMELEAEVAKLIEALGESSG